MTFDTRGFTMMGVSPAQAVAALDELGVAAAGGNCGNGPDEIEGVIHGMRQAHPRIPLVAKSNAGMPEIVDGRAVYSGTPAVMALYARRVRALGADIIGACCGSTPAHVKAMRDALHTLPALQRDQIELASAPAQRQPTNGARLSREERRARRGA
jgi:5-methyltetrahydrofolate--homocysteine methyltransferase